MVALPCWPFELSLLNELYKGKLVRSITFTLRIITSNIYTRLAACNCISITFWSGDLPSPLMAIFYLDSLQDRIRGAKTPVIKFVQKVSKNGLTYFCILP